MPSRPHSALDRNWHWALLALILATVAIRWPYLGNPLIDADEQFYLLTGDRLLHGTLPYVDIWDRKPLGLFLLYAAIRLIGGDGILQYQLVACASAAATACLIATMARRIAGPGAALGAALAYLPSLGLSGGAGGQTPVFYNLPMAAAAWLVLSQFAPDKPPRLSLRWAGTLAMLLVGLAIQLKPNAVFEGLYFGLALLWLSWRAAPRSATILDALLWIAAALLPTALAWAGYAAIGHGPEFAFANFGSIFARAGVGASAALHNLGHDLGRLAPLLVALLFAEGILRRLVPWQDSPVARRAHGFLLGWLVAAAIGFAIFGTYFNHYVLPLLPPLLIVIAPAFSVRKARAGATLGALLILTLGAWYAINAQRDVLKRGNGAYAYAMADRITPLLGRDRCLFVFYGAPIYYHLTHSCLLTRWPFPYHISLAREEDALGVPPVIELRRILAQKPAVILDKQTDDPEVNLETQAILRAELARNYRLLYTHPFTEGRPEADRLWQRLPGR